jgi:hypothetical protein
VHIVVAVELAQYTEVVGAQEQCIVVVAGLAQQVLDCKYIAIVVEEPRWLGPAQRLIGCTAVAVAAASFEAFDYTASTAGAVGRPTDFEFAAAAAVVVRLAFASASA